MGRVHIVRRIELEGLDAGLTSEHYVEYRPQTYADRAKLADSKADKNASNEEASKLITDLIKKHVVSGRIPAMVDGEVQTVDLEESDIDDLPEPVNDRIIAEITGARFADPKAMSATTEPSQNPIEQPTNSQAIGESTTGTTSSED